MSVQETHVASKFADRPDSIRAELARGRLLPGDIGRRLGAPDELQLLEQTAHVCFDRVFAEVQLGRDLPICLAFGDQRQDLALLLGESVTAVASSYRGPSHPVQ